VRSEWPDKSMRDVLRVLKHQSQRGFCRPQTVPWSKFSDWTAFGHQIALDTGNVSVQLPALRCSPLSTPRLIVSLAASIPFLAFSCIPMHAAPILSENFDEVPAVLGVTTAGAFSAINGTNVDVVGAADSFGYLCAGPESGNCVDMGGTGGNAYGVIELTTPLTLAAGTYNLSFDLIGSGRGETTSTTVDFGSYSQTFVLASGDITSGVVVNQAVTIAGGPTQLEFINNGISDPNIGALLDNVSITAASPSAAPEPSSLMLMGTGILGAAGLMRRRLKV
jgi:hypothetical protein